VHVDEREEEQQGLGQQQELDGQLHLPEGGGRGEVYVEIMGEQIRRPMTLTVEPTPHRQPPPESKWHGTVYPAYSSCCSAKSKAKIRVLCAAGVLHPVGNYLATTTTAA